MDRGRVGSGKADLVRRHYERTAVAAVEGRELTEIGCGTVVECP